MDWGDTKTLIRSWTEMRKLTQGLRGLIERAGYFRETVFGSPLLGKATVIWDVPVASHVRITATFRCEECLQ